MNLTFFKTNSGHLFFGVIFILALYSSASLPTDARIAIGIFILSIWAWTATKTDATLIAVIAVLSMKATGLSESHSVMSSLGDPFVSFVIAGFMLGGAYKAAGLSERIAGWFAQHSSNIAQLFYLLTTALVLLSFVVPSTSARAALLMPVYIVVASHCPNANVRKGLAVLFPTIIVLSCITSYLGAGANLMTADLIARFSGEQITYVQWLMLGTPIGLASCFLSTWIILKIFLTDEDRKQTFKFEMANTEHNHNASAQYRVLAVSGLLIGFWMTEPFHGIDAGFITMAGAVLLCLPNIGVMSFKLALKEVEWSLVIFMAATIELSKGLIDSGLITQLMQYFSTSMTGWSGLSILYILIGVSLISHLFIHSRTARAAIMLPVLIPIGMAAGHGGLMVAFFTNAAMGYCLTLPVCAKPVAMFSTAGNEGYTTKDLLRLSVWLLPLHMLLLVGAFFVYNNILSWN